MNIIVTKDTDIDELFQIFHTEIVKKNPEPITLVIDYAKHFPIDRLKRLSYLINGKKLKIKVETLGDIDFTEFVLAALCNTTQLHIPEGCKINMVTLAPVSTDDLTKIAKLVSEKTFCTDEDIIKGYENKATISPEDILTKIDDDEE